MSDVEHAALLLRIAQADLAALRGMQHPALRDSAFFSDEVFGFHAHQAVEKTLKAWLTAAGLRYPRTHDLIELIRSLADAGHAVDELYDLADLNPFAVQYRYEALVQEDDRIDRAEVLSRVEGLVKSVAEVIAGMLGER